MILFFFAHSIKKRKLHLWKQLQVASAVHDLIRITDRYRVLFWNLIPLRKKSGRDNSGNADLFCVPL